ncbi:hypothetical protein [Streptomyces sp. SD15]
MSGTRRRRGSVRQLAGGLLAAVAVLGVSGAAWSVPQMRTVLRDSFTERQQSYMELYFTKDPWFDGNDLVVPLALTEHGDTGGRHEIKASAQDPDGKRLATNTVTVTTKPGAQVATDVRLRIKGKKSDADLIKVSLPGHAQRLQVHLR